MKKNSRDGSPQLGFVAHALDELDRGADGREAHLSTSLIRRQCESLRLPADADGHILWLHFPVKAPLASGGYDIVVRFYIILRGPRRILAGIRGGESFRAIEAVVTEFMNGLSNPRVPGCLVMGALTKEVTGHGRLLLAEHPWLAARVATTHGDAGSVALVLEAMRRSGVGRHSRIAVIGAGGAIGSGLAALLPEFWPQCIVLVGAPDRPGSNERLEQLMAVQQALVQSGFSGEVCLDQDMHHACVRHRTNVVIVATRGQETLSPADVPEGTIIFDITAPPACRSDPAWEERSILVFTAGCGRFEDESLLPEGFGLVAGEAVWDLGMGRAGIWGCTAEGIARTMFGWRGQIATPEVLAEEVRWCDRHFQAMRFGPQPPNMFGRALDWGRAQAHLGRARLFARTKRRV